MVPHIRMVPLPGCRETCRDAVAATCRVTSCRIQESGGAPTQRRRSAWVGEERVSMTRVISWLLPGIIFAAIVIPPGLMPGNAHAQTSAVSIANFAFAPQLLS